MYLPNHKSRRAATAVFLLPSMVGILVFCLLPIVMSLFYSFHDYDLLAGSMDYLGLKNFSRILSGREFPQVLGHTLTYLGLYLPLILIASLGQALVLNRTSRSERGRKQRPVAQKESQRWLDGLRAAARLVSYGWGMIPVQVRLGGTEWRTSLWPKDGGYIVPIKAAVRRAEAVDEGDEVTVSLAVGP